MAKCNALSNKVKLNCRLPASSRNCERLLKLFTIATVSNIIFRTCSCVCVYLWIWFNILFNIVFSVWIAIYVKCSSTIKYRRKYRKFIDNTVPSTTSIHKLIRKICFPCRFWTRNLVINAVCKIEAGLEYTPLRSLRRLAQEIRICELPEIKETKLF